jgi:dinuclear metal center YbgI/SA1388 family protein
VTRLHELTEYLESIAPSHLQESYDNSGLIVGDPLMEIRGVIVCLDSTEEVVEEAIEKGCNVIVAHHPIVFNGLKRFVGANYIERTVIKAIKNDIAIYSIHTNLDNVKKNGVNGKIAEKLGLKDLKILAPKMPEESDIGAGMVGFLNEAMHKETFLKMVKTTMQADCVKYTKWLKESVSKIAICGGSGSFLLETAMEEKCDVFITSDFKYHQFFDANNKIVILDIGHYETEQFTIDLLVGIITDKFSNFAAHYTKVDTNPVKYY